MTPQRFAKAVMRTVVDDGVTSYKNIFAHPGTVTEPYWVRVLALYRSLPRSQRKVVLDIMRQVQVDTVSHLFGILDGSTGLDGRAMDLELTARARKRRVRLDGGLQDLFLALEEERRPSR